MRSRALAGIISLLLLACGPKIQEFSVAPRHVCSGDTVTVTFKTRGTPHLTTTDFDSATVRRTRYTIVAEKGGKQAFSQMDVYTYSPDAVPVLAFDTDMLGSDSLVARETLPAASWPDLLQVERVVVDSGRPLRVMHGGTGAVVAPGGGGSDWAGLPVGGEWEVHAALLPGEIPGNPAHHPPAHLELSVTLRCGAEGGTP